MNPKDKAHSNQLGLIGLGVMGRNLAMNFLDKGIRLSVYNREVAGLEQDVAKNFVLENPAAKDFDDLRVFARSLETPRKILLMIHAGSAVDEVIAQLIPFLSPGDVLMDGGNSYFGDTNRRLQYLSGHGILYLGVGISGGEEGARRGPSVMPGGSVEAYNAVAPFLESIAARDTGNNPCCAYIGPQGSGHFVKMVHNGIEYAEMQLIAEVYDLMRHLPGFPPEKIAAVFDQWQQEGVGSYLLEITRKILIKKEGTDYLLYKILDAAEQKGTGGWSAKTAFDLGVPLNTISEAVNARIISSFKERRLEAHPLYPSLNKNRNKLTVDTEQLKKAYSSARVINHAIGFSLLQEASLQYKWNLPLSEISRIWTNGCIIRSSLMEKLVHILKTHPQLLLNPQIAEQLQEEIPAQAQVISQAMTAGYALPVHSAALNYFNGFITADSSASLIQAQRDYFGAHTYRRTDMPPDQYFHTDWKL